ncbi:unnamed protein product [Cladocopium goreaui]|uniref:JmjC domain-containing protein n=1 Tax=Cladocopium goreaui TaxID=2562237 RepID=A0A9P1G8J4_9DINO|nr:unnamed protein product [Cladocopium goreaui]
MSRLALLPGAAAFTLLQSPLWEPELQALSVEASMQWSVKAIENPGPSYGALDVDGSCDHFEPLRNFTPKNPLADDFEKPTAVIPRYRKLTAGQLQDLVSNGQPFVVEDCGQDAPLISWSCKDYALRWPEGKMRAEYSEGQRPILLGDADWFRTLRPTGLHSQHLSKGDKLAGPYIWHVKDHEPNQCCNSTETCWPVKRSVQEHWRTPYFLRQQHINAQEAKDSFELWFSLAGGGALSHADAYNEMTLSLQLRGSKEWRLAMHPPVATAFDAIESHDGGIYKSKRWMPEYDFTLHQGECFVFPPGYFHETFVRPDAAAEHCTVAATFQFIAPLPARYWRNFLPRWFNSHLSWEEHSLEVWAPVATLSHQGGTNWEVSARTSLLLRKLDSDQDERVSYAEVDAFFQRPENHWATDKDFAWFPFVPADQAAQVKDEVAWELRRSVARAVVDFHDLDGDGQISGSELYTSLWQWKVLVQKKRSLMKLFKKRKGKTNSQDVLRFEIDFLRQHAGCSQLGRLRAEAACQRLSELQMQNPIGQSAEIPLFRVIAGEEDEEYDIEESKRREEL